MLCPSVERGALCYYCACSALMPSGSQTDWVWAAACLFFPSRSALGQCLKIPSANRARHLLFVCPLLHEVPMLSVAVELRAAPGEAAVPLQSRVLLQGQGAWLLLGRALCLWHRICCLECEALLQFLNWAFTQQHRQHKLF